LCVLALRLLCRKPGVPYKEGKENKRTSLLLQE
jgi:hypothetical protein